MKLTQAKEIKLTFQQAFYYPPIDKRDNGEYHPTYTFSIQPQMIPFDEMDLALTEIKPHWMPHSLDEMGNFNVKELLFKAPSALLDVKDDTNLYTVRELLEFPYNKENGERIEMRSFYVRYDSRRFMNDNGIFFHLSYHTNLTRIEENNMIQLVATYPEKNMTNNSVKVEDADVFMKKYQQIVSKRDALYLEEDKELFGVEQPLEDDACETFVLIEELDLSVRSYNCLKRAHIDTIDQLVCLSDEELKHIKNIGKKGVQEIREKCHEAGIETNFKHFDPYDVNYLLYGEDGSADVTMTEVNTTSTCHEYNIRVLGNIPMHDIYSLAYEDEYIWDSHETAKKQIEEHNQKYNDTLKLSSDSVCGISMQLLEYPTETRGIGDVSRGYLKVLYPVSRRFSSNKTEYVEVCVGKIEPLLFDHILRYVKEHIHEYMDVK